MKLIKKILSDQFLLGISYKLRRILILSFLDFSLILLSFMCAFITRNSDYDFSIARFDQLVIIYFIIFALLFFFFKVYKLKLDDQTVDIFIKISVIGNLIFSAIIYFKYDRGIVPRSVPIISTLYIFSYLIFSRFIFLKFKYYVFFKDLQNIAIYGDSINAKILKNLIEQKKTFNVSFFFSNKNIGINEFLKIDNVPIYYDLNSIKKNILKKNIKKIYLLNNLDQKFFDKDFYKILKERKISTEKVSDLEQSINTNIFLSNERLFYERIFNKNLFNYNIEDQKKIFINKSVLITGGLGSIGNSIFELLLKCRCKKIYLLDKSEIEIFNNKAQYKEGNVQLLLGDINDDLYLNNIFSKNKFDYVFHTAAYKHVSIVQNNIFSALQNNIFGTEKIIKYSIKNNIKNLIFISSDKAVYPSTVMGMTKRVGELLIKLYSNKSNKTNMYSVRFGNVIGSSGSVIPIFLNKIKTGKDIIVSHPKVERYFMSSYESAYLITKILSLPIYHKKRGDIFILDMGKAYKILDVAKKLIKLFGAENNIKIRFGKLLKEEKMSEKLFYDTELISNTNQKKILRASDKKINLSLFEKKLARLKKLILNKKNVNEKNLKELLIQIQKN